MSRFTRAIMVLCCYSAMATSVTAQTAADINQQFNTAYQQQEWDKAIELGKKLAELRPDDPAPAYNVACVLALKGESNESARWLLMAATRGFSDRTLAANDRDLDSIRNLRAYDIAMDRVGANQLKAFAEFKVMAADSKPLVMVPDGLDPQQPAPLIIAMHGYGDTVENFARVWKKAAEDRGAILVLPRAVRSAGTGFQWGEVNEADWLLTRALDAATAQHNIDPRKIVLTGFSQGGYMSYNLGMKHRDRITGVIPVAGQYTRSLAEAPANGPRPRVYIMVGSEDREEGSNRLAHRDYRAVGMRVELVVYPGLGHTFPENSDAELLKALAFVMP